MRVSAAPIETQRRTKGGRILDGVKPQRIRSLPIPIVSASQRKPIEVLVRRILQAKRRNADADTSVIEREMNGAVYALYDLTSEEISLVEAKTA